MSRTSTVVWSVIGSVAAILGILVAVYGPNLYREGKALVGPIVELSKAEERVAALDSELPFVTPADGDVAEDRLLDFLAIRRELLPRYQRWQAMKRRLEARGEEDWRTAKEVLIELQQVLNLQIATLRAHGMSPAEFNWIEDKVYGVWLPRVEGAISGNAVTDSLRRSTEEDLERLTARVARFGSSEISRRFASHLEERLDSLDNPGPPPVEGVSPKCSALLWEHRDELRELDMESFPEFRSAMRGSRNVNVTIDGE